MPPEQVDGRCARQIRELSACGFSAEGHVVAIHRQGRADLPAHLRAQEADCRGEEYQRRWGMCRGSVPAPRSAATMRAS